MTRRIAALLLLPPFLLSACFAHEAPPRHAEPVPAAPPAPVAAPAETPPPAQDAPPPPAPPVYAEETYDDGVIAGERAAEDAFVAGYAALGFVAAPLVVVCCLAAAGGGGGGGGGNCGGGGGGPSSREQYLPPNAVTHSEAYVRGYDEGYYTRLEDRKSSALAGGFLAGVLVMIAGVAVYYAQPGNEAEARCGARPVEPLTTRCRRSRRAASRRCGRRCPSPGFRATCGPACIRRAGAAR